jgi:hypothetical protein
VDRDRQRGVRGAFSAGLGQNQDLPRATAVGGSAVRWHFANVA